MLEREKSERIKAYFVDEVWHYPEPGYYFQSEDEWILVVNSTTGLETRRVAKVSSTGYPRIQEIVWEEPELPGPKSDLPA